MQPKRGKVLITAVSSADPDGGSANRLSSVKINWYFNVKFSITLNTTINDK